MKLKFFIIISVISLFVLTSCSPEKISSLEKPTVTEDVSQPENEKRIIPEIKLPKFFKKTYQDPAIAELIERSKPINDYSYSFKSRIKDSLGNFQEKTYDVTIKENKIKKTLNKAIKVEGMAYSEVYFDTVTKTAFAICEKKYLLCQEEKSSNNLSYGSELIPFFPLDLMEKIPLDAQIMGRETISNRKTIIISYINDEGRLERLFVDDFYSIPLKQTIYEDNNLDLIFREYTFLRMAVGNVRNSDVLPPNEFLN